MARMPDESAIAQTQISSRSVRRAPRDFIGGAVADLGRTITHEADLDQDLALRVKRKAKAEGDALDQARADADWSVRLTGEVDQADLTKNPDYSKWGKRAETNLPKHLTASAGMFQDPKQGELWKLRHQDDIVRTTSGIKNKAQDLDNGKRRAEGLAAVDTMLASATMPGISKEQSYKIVAQAHASLDNLHATGLLNPEQVVEARQNFAKKYASLKIDQDKEANPEQTLRWLNGPSNTVYFNKLRKHETSGDDSATPGTSSAQGRYQFTEGTWDDVRKAHPELGLTANGRSNGDQQELAIRAFTADNAALLEKNGFPPSEANLYLAHFMGATGAIKALTANQNAPAAEMFPDAAKANKSIFYNADGSARSVGEVVALQTKNFSGQGGPAPDYYQLVAPDERIRLASAAEAEWARRDKESREKTALDNYVMGNRVDDDISQIENTGQVSNLGTQEVYDTLGDAGTAKWLERRATAAETYKATSVLDGLENNDIEAHVAELEPSPGDANFERKQKIYDATKKKADHLIELRLKDPAKSVEESSLVKTALQSYDPAKPESVQALVKARLAAQDAVGIRGASASPVTRRESQAIIGPIINTIDSMEAAVLTATMDEKGVAGAKRLAAKAVRKEAETQIRTLLGEVETLYGPYAHQVMAHAITEYVKDRQTGDIVGSIFSKIGRGERVSEAEISKVQAVTDVAASEKAMNPAPEPQAYPRGQGRIEQMKKANEANKTYPKPSQRAVDYLRQNPETVADFEKNFGPGVAAQWLPRK